jgi:hypothetical protein
MISNPARGHSFRAAFVGTNDEAAGPERPPSALLVRMSPSPPVWRSCGPKSKIQFNGVGGLRTYISFTHSSRRQVVRRARFPHLIQMVRRQKSPALAKQNLEKQIARCRRDLSRMGKDAATESLRAFLADLEDRLRNLETQ